MQRSLPTLALLLLLSLLPATATLSAADSSTVPEQASVTKTTLVPPPSQALVTGILLDEEGAPVPGVTVSTRGGKLCGESKVWTDSEGRYVLPPLAPGDYVLRFELAGMVTVEAEIELSRDEVVEVDVEMCIDPDITLFNCFPRQDRFGEFGTNETTITRQQMDLLPI